MHKRYVDPLQFELNKAMIYRGHSAQFVTFYTPSKSGDFKPDNYPDCPSDQAAMNCNEYWGGQNKEPVLF